MVEAAFVAHFPIPPIYPYLPFTPGYLIVMYICLSVSAICNLALIYILATKTLVQVPLGEGLPIALSKEQWKWSIILMS